MYRSLTPTASPLEASAAADGSALRAACGCASCCCSCYGCRCCAPASNGCLLFAPAGLLSTPPWCCCVLLQLHVPLVVACARTRCSCCGGGGRRLPVSLAAGHCSMTMMGCGVGFNDRVCETLHMYIRATHETHATHTTHLDDPLEWALLVAANFCSPWPSTPHYCNVRRTCSPKRSLIITHSPHRHKDKQDTTKMLEQLSSSPAARHARACLSSTLQHGLRLSEDLQTRLLLNVFGMTVSLLHAVGCSVGRTASSASNVLPTDLSMLAAAGDCPALAVAPDSPGLHAEPHILPGARNVGVCVGVGAVHAAARFELMRCDGGVQQWAAEHP